MSDVSGIVSVIEMARTLYDLVGFKTTEAEASDPSDSDSDELSTPIATPMFKKNHFI